MYLRQQLFLSRDTLQFHTVRSFSVQDVIDELVQGRPTGYFFRFFLLIRPQDGDERAFLFAVEGFEYLYVAIDKFTKWPEVEAVRKETAQSAVKFFKGLVCRFGVPNRVIIDNDT